MLAPEARRLPVASAPTTGYKPIMVPTPLQADPSPRIERGTSVQALSTSVSTPASTEGVTRVASESVPVRGWYCEAHDVLLPQGYNDAAADGQVAIEGWLALPIRTETGQHLLALVRKAGLLDTTENRSGVAGSEGGRGE